MDYDKANLARFLKEGGQDKALSVDKATLKRKDLDGKQGHILVLAPQINSQIFMALFEKYPKMSAEL